jgi:hypothetical protein
MDKEQINYFEALTKDAMKSAEALESPRLKGVKNSVVEKYSDQAHFVYELLQNADDAKATSVRFELFKDKLVFAHNGTRRFSVSNPATEEDDLKNGKLGDINAITSIGRSGKTDGSTIGKFGVGFKAVFQYTATPHIYDPNVFFKIERFIVPIRLKDDFPGRRDGETLFVFPFDHEKRNPEEAFVDISEKLRTLDFPLLFLSNLKNIEFEVSGILGLYGKKVEETYNFKGTNAEFIRLTQNDGANREELYDDLLWLFTREDENKHKYSVGFFVDNEGHLKPNTHSAFCFFPTKEVTGLNFIIHAPFLLTDSREGIRAGIQHNLEMISLLSTLAADSLVYLRDIGRSKHVMLIDDSIFDIVPYDQTGFSDVNSKKTISFKPFYTAILEIFETEEVLPTLGNSYVSSSNAYWGGIDNSQMAEVFSNDQLAFLTGNKNSKWVFASLSTPRSAGRNTKFEYIRWIVDNVVTDNAIIDLISKDFVESQDIEWLHSFYMYISTNSERTRRIKTKPIFIDSLGKAVSAYDAKDQAILFLPSDGESNFTIINKALMQNEDTVEFVRRIGITFPSLRDEIYNIILPQYKDDNFVSTKSHFKIFFQYYISCSQTTVTSFLDLLRSYKFVLCQIKDDEKKYRATPSNLYFPYEQLTSWFTEKPKALFVCFDEYLELVGLDKKQELVRFLSDLGVNDMPKIIERVLTEDEVNDIKPIYKWPQPAYYKMNTRKWSERYIDGLQQNLNQVLTEKDSALSLKIWDQLLRFVECNKLRALSRDSILFGKYEYFFRTYQTETFESTEAKRLRTLPWLIDINGEFVTAGELSTQTLSSHYSTTSDAYLELIRILGIKEKSILPDKDVDISIYGAQLGLTEEEQRLAFQEFVKRKKEENESDSLLSSDYDAELNSNSSIVEEDDDIDSSDKNQKTIKRIGREITQRAISLPKEKSIDIDSIFDEDSSDEDDYTKPTVDISKKITKVKEQAERDIQEIARLEDLKQKAQESKTYSYGWFKALIQLELLNSGDNNSRSREISISFAKIERDGDTSRYLVLKHPNRYIPHSMEDLADIPLELHFAEKPMIKVAVEVVNVKSYTLRAKLRTNVQIDGIDLSQVVEARIEARNPVFLIDELRKAFDKLGEDHGYKDDFDMQSNLCENIEFIFGPPGTGKTTHLARNIIHSMMSLDQELKVLVLTPTNKSADVLVRRLMENMGTNHSYLNWLVRFGTTNDSEIEQSGVFRDKTFDIRTFLRNVTVTTIARFPYDYFLPDDGSRLHLSALNWDYIIIDEASMIPIVNIIYPIYKKTPKKFFIAGDPFQIEPITTVDTWKNENIYTMVKLNSFIEPLTVPHKYHVELLTTQYRSIPDIGEVFSRFAYDGVIKHNRSSNSQRSLPIKEFIDLQPVNIIKFPVSKFESIYKPKRLQNKTPYQVYSALFAFEFVKYLASLIDLVTRDEDFRVGLIAPYRAQADLIDKLMTSAKISKKVSVQVGTIHGFQGDECDIIIALFNPPPKISMHKDMFLNKLNIVNVSISRARDYLIILMPDDETEDVGNLTLIKSVENLCKGRPSWTEYLSPVLEEIMFGSKTYLEDNSFSTSHQLVNVYGKPEKRYEIRSEDNAVDVQIHD